MPLRMLDSSHLLTPILQDLSGEFLRSATANQSCRRTLCEIRELDCSNRHPLQCLAIPTKGWPRWERGRLELVLDRGVQASRAETRL